LLLALALSFPSELQPIKSEGTLDACTIKMVDPKNLNVTKLVAQAQLVVSLEFVAVAGTADALKVFPPVWIAQAQTPDQPRRDDVIDMAPHSGMAEICPARLDFALSP
jgi:hypothetical protein